MRDEAVSTDNPAALRRALCTVTGERPTRRALHAVVDRCHQMACAYLRRQQQAGALREDVLGEDVDDLAIDAIAGLFERDDRGGFPELRRYFADRDLAATDPSTVEQDLRRLVLGTVSDWLFETYRSADRSLSNVIRALKRAADSLDDVHLRRRGQNLWLRVQDPSSPSHESADARSSAPGRRMPIENLEAHLTGIVAETPSTKDLLREAVETLRAHPDYEAAYPVTRLAQALRAARVRVQAVTDHESGTTCPEDPLFRPDEIESEIEKSLARIREDKRETYVKDGPLDESTYAAYIRALRDRLEARFVPPGDADLTNHDALATHWNGDLSRAQYRDEHRARFEYLDRCAREVLVDRLQEAMSPSEVR